MGSLQAQEMAEMLDTETAIHWHLRSNHYPPVPESMVPVCVEAIEAALEDYWEKEITLPEGVSWRGSDTAPAYAIIEGHHLHAWVQLDEEYEDED